MTATPLAAAERLADILSRENDALKAMDLPRAVALLPAKAAAAADLRLAGEAWATRGSGFAHPDLIAAARKLDGLARENRALLERAIAVQHRVIGIVVRAAASAQPRASYGVKGQLFQSGSPMALSTRA